MSSAHNTLGGLLCCKVIALVEFIVLCAYNTAGIRCVVTSQHYCGFITAS